MKLTLHLNGEKQTYQTPPFVSGLLYRKVLEMQANGRFPSSVPEHVDEMVEHICTAFGNKFNIDEFWEGIHAPEVNNIILQFVGFVNGVNDDNEGDKKEGKQ